MWNNGKENKKELILVHTEQHQTNSFTSHKIECKCIISPTLPLGKQAWSYWVADKVHAEASAGTRFSNHILLHSSFSFNYILTCCTVTFTGSEERRSLQRSIHYTL